MSYSSLVYGRGRAKVKRQLGLSEGSGADGSADGVGHNGVTAEW